MFSVCVKLLWQASSPAHTVTYTVTTARWTYLRFENTLQHINFTSIQKLSFQYLRLSHNLQLFYERFKCHTCYSASIKVDWMPNTVFSKEMFYTDSPGIIGSALLPIVYLCTNNWGNTHTPWRRYQWFFFTHIQPNTELSQMYKCSCAGIILSLYLLYQQYLSVCKFVTAANVQGQASVLAVHTHAHTLHLPTALCAMIGKLTGQHTVTAAQLGR